ncbi:hypothetical protein PN462_18045 [Spirulina sp. CS-785/01]|uniref:hypothetical protein n=1 Tax=Spirulina sp. CS-785/01 TaxID=3021716 RepID=UPI00232FF185|nr:hypothetical protein [Spirulina sp. CS-785/01]MDB9315021.1 hypothetical protein [Spirulina sp. CS-785/01]
MNLDTITAILEKLFPQTTVEQPSQETWQVVTEDFRLLALLSEDLSWLRVMLPIAPGQQAQVYFEQLLQGNFDTTQEAKYALYQGVLWGVYEHRLNTLTPEDLENAIARLIRLNQDKLNTCFDRLVEQRVRQIIRAAKAKGQDLETTMQQLERFYQEGMLGDLEQSEDSRNRVLAAWRSRLEQLWNEE